MGLCRKIDDIIETFSFKEREDKAFVRDVSFDKEKVRLLSYGRKVIPVSGVG